MALTPNSGLTSWLTPQVFFQFCDWRPIAQLVKDDNISSDYVSLTTPGNPAYALLLELLQAACGRFEAALLRGNRYQAADLAGLPQGSNAAAFRDELLSRIAQYTIFKRRPSLLPNYKDIAAEVQKTLDDLASGEAIFPFIETQNAGVLVSERDSFGDVEERHLTSTLARRVFGTRGNQLWRGSGY